MVRVVPSGGAPMNNSDMMGFCRVHLIRRIHSSSSATATATGTTSTTPPPICSLCSTETRGKSLKPSRMAEFRWETRVPLPVDVLTNKCLQNDNTKVPFTSVMLVKNVAVVVITSDHGPAKTEVGDHDAGNGRGHDHYNGKV